MLIDNIANLSLDTLICPVSREPLAIFGDSLITDSGYIFPEGDFRVVSSDAQSKTWAEGQKHYESFEHNWITNSMEFYEAIDKETAEIYEKFKLKGLVLDVGGGYGTLVKQASLDPSRVIVIDAMVRKWDEIPNFNYKVHYKELSKVVRIPGFAEDLPFKNRSFDTIHMRSCLDHFANPYRALLEARRVLKKDGSLIIGLMLEGGFKLEEAKLMNWIKKKIKKSFIGELHEHLFDKHIFHPTEHNLKLLIDKTGFKIEKWIFQTGYHNVVYLEAKIEDMKSN